MGSSAPIGDQPLVLFDGVCNLCNGSVQFIITRDHQRRFQFASLQSQAAETVLKKFGLRSEELYSILLFKDGILYDRSDALLEIAKDLNGFWSFTAVFKFLPKVLRDSLYNLIARNRYTLFGKQDSCMIPTPELRARFVD